MGASGSLIGLRHSQGVRSEAARAVAPRVGLPVLQGSSRCVLLSAAAGVAWVKGIQNQARHLPTCTGQFSLQQVAIVQQSLLPVLSLTFFAPLPPLPPLPADPAPAWAAPFKTRNDVTFSGSTALLQGWTSSAASLAPSAGFLTLAAYDGNVEINATISGWELAQ